MVMQLLKSQLAVENLDLELVRTYLYKSYRQLVLSKPTKQRILFILGCQRSGTSLMTRIFFRDIYAKVYRESSKLSSQDIEKLRLNSLDLVQKNFENEKAPLIVLKPLVESQNTPQLLDFFANSAGLWLYRHYKDVAISNLRAFGMTNGIADLRPIIENQVANWRSEKVSCATRAIIAEHFVETMNPHDAAALFWFARNQLFFELGLESHPRVFLCQYEALVTQPKSIMREIYKSIGCTYPGDQIISEVHANSLKRGGNIQLSPPIEKLCNELWERINCVYDAQMAKR